MFEPVHKKSLTDAVYEQLRDRILTGDVAPGGDLPSERVLADMLQVSRPAVREALRRLEQARLVSIRHGEATRVRHFRAEAGLDLLSQMLVSPDGRVDTTVARSIMEMRATIAPDIARLAALRGGDVVPRLEAIVAEMREHRQDAAALQDLSHRFWDALVDGSGNVAYRLAFNTLHETYAKVKDLLTSVMKDEWTDLESFAAIVSAVKGKRPAAAERHARTLMARGTEALMPVLEHLATEEGVTR